MSFGYVVLIVLFAVSAGVFTYVDARRSVKQSMPELLRAVFTLLVVGVTVRIIRKIGMAESLLFIIALVGIVFFYIVWYYVIRVPEREKLGKVTVFGHVVSGAVGFARGWLYYGFFLVLLSKIFHPNIPQTFYHIGAFAARLCLLLSF